MIVRIWMTLIFLLLLSNTWAEDGEKTRHSLIHRPQASTGSDASARQNAPAPISPSSVLGTATTPTAQTGSSTPPQTSATNSQNPSAHLPGAMQRLLRANPSLGQLLPPSSPSVTVPPPMTPTNTPPSPTPPPLSSVGQATLTWRPNTEWDLAGYRVYVGTSSGMYDFPGSPFTVGKVTTYTVTNLPSQTTYFFALSAYDIAGNESPFSIEVSKSIF